MKMCLFFVASGLESSNSTKSAFRDFQLKCSCNQGGLLIKGYK